MNVETIIGVAASTFSAASLVPQLVKVIKEKEAENISMGMLVVLFIGLGLWLYYGIIKKDIIIIASNAFSLAINFILAVFTMKYKKNTAVN